MKRKLDEILSNHYSNDYTEDDRLTKDLTHKVEYITTLKYIDKYLGEGDRILDVTLEEAKAKICESIDNYKK